MITYNTTSSLTDLYMTAKLLNGLENYYPDFNYWFINKCVPGILIGDDSLIVAKEHDQLIGVVLGKKDIKETKLRCIRVLPEYQNKGIGIHLIEKMLYKLDDDKPHCTVSEEMLHQFSRPFINLFNFNLSKVDKGLYRENKLEYIFN